MIFAQILPPLALPFQTCCTSFRRRFVFRKEQLMWYQHHYTGARSRAVSSPPITDEIIDKLVWLYRLSKRVCRIVVATYLGLADAGNEKLRSHRARDMERHFPKPFPIMRRMNTITKARDNMPSHIVVNIGRLLLKPACTPWAFTVRNMAGIWLGESTVFTAVHVKIISRDTTRGMIMTISGIIAILHGKTSAQYRASTATGKRRKLKWKMYFRDGKRS